MIKVNYQKKEKEIAKRSTKYYLTIMILLCSTCICSIPEASAQKMFLKNPAIFLAYPTDTLPILDQSKVATILTANGLEVDGVEATKKNMRSANTGLIKACMVDVLPGKHSVKALYKDGKRITMKAFEFEFEAGHLYFVYIGLDIETWDSAVTLSTMYDDDDEFKQQLAEKRKTAKFKQPKE
jgi:hypothetical protein